MEENPRFRLSLVSPLKQHDAVEEEILKFAKKRGYEVLTQKREFVDDLTVSVVTDFAARRGVPELKAIAGHFEASGGIRSVEWQRL